MTTRTSMHTDSGAVTVLEMKTTATRDHLRFSISGAGVTGPMAEMYTIVDGTAGTMTSVTPHLRMATTLDMADMTGGNPLMKMAVTGEPLLEVDDLGRGETILGMPTHRYHFKAESTMRITVGSASCEKTSITDGDTWTTPAIDMRATMSDAMMSVMHRGGGMGLSKFGALYRKKVPGVPLKWIGTTTIRSSDGRTAVMQGTMDVTEAVKSKIANSQFTVPADYRTMDSRQMMAGMDLSAMEEAIPGGAAGFLKRVCDPAIPPRQ